MGQIGSIAHHFHEGARSEYLAQYVLSAFGVAVPVPRPEDSGIDLYCGIGKEVGKRLLIENCYVVQVKSDKNDIVYEPEASVKWILSQKYPFIVCIVYKKKGLVEFYQTLQLSRFFPVENIRRLVLSFSMAEYGNFVQEKNGEVKLLLDTPILKVKVQDVDNKKLLLKYKDILKSWIQLDQDNINRKNLGINAVIFPPKIVTNSKIVQERKLEGNFLKHILHTDLAHKYYENLFFLLSYEINNTVAKGNKEQFEALSDCVAKILAILDLKDSYGIRMLQIAVNKGAEKLKSNRKLNLFKNGTAITTNSVKIIG